MSRPHVAFIVESAYGHLVPTVGIALELMERGYRVSYAVKEIYQDSIRRCGAEAFVYTPLENKNKVFVAGKTEAEVVALFAGSYWKNLWREETEDTHAQLMQIYENDRPDLIIYDCMNPAGRTLAKALDAPAAEHAPIVIYEGNPHFPYDESLVLVAIPRFFHRKAEELDPKYKFIGFVRPGRENFFVPWNRRQESKRTILVYATTGFLPQVEFLKIAIAAFRDTEWRLVLSGGNEAISALPASLPENCEINRGSSNLEILETADLIIAQGGTGATLEALYSGVPQVLIPLPYEIFEDCATRVAELGLGVRLDSSQLTAERLRDVAYSIMNDGATRLRLKKISQDMHLEHGEVKAADLIEQHLESSRRKTLLA